MNFCKCSTAGHTKTAYPIGKRATPQRICFRAAPLQFNPIGGYSIVTGTSVLWPFGSQRLDYGNQNNKKDKPEKVITSCVGRAKSKIHVSPKNPYASLFRQNLESSTWLVNGWVYCPAR